jgi:putative (di)nucleoside polyphosphate hydrolase
MRSRKLSLAEPLWQSARTPSSELHVVIDPDGYRPNVGIILMRDDAKLFWARRVTRDGWQFPQGGMNSDETPIEAMYRELHEEVGLAADDVRVLGSTPGWLRYRLPKRCIRRNERPTCIGQKQVWFLLQLVEPESKIRFDATETPEFTEFRWVDFWYPLSSVVSFKRDVYLRALSLLVPAARNASGLALPASPEMPGLLPDRRGAIEGMGQPATRYG